MNLLRHLKKAPGIILYMGSPLFIVFLLISQFPHSYDQRLWTMVAGVTAYTAMLWQLVISAKPKWLESQWGLTSLMKFHGLVPLAAILMAALHSGKGFPIPRVYTGSHLPSLLGSIALWLFIATSAFAILYFWLRNPTKPRLRYKHALVLHNAVIVPVIFMQVHVLTSSAAHGSPFLFATYMVYFLVALFTYLYHKALRSHLGALPYTISHVVKESADTIQIFLTATSTNKTLLCLPGQFAYFQFLIGSSYSEPHPFSIVTKERGGLNLSIIVKNFGPLTKQVQLLSPSTPVLVSGPYGQFTYSNHTDEGNLIFIAGGIGITPFISMLYELAHQGDSRSIYLYWSTQNPNEYAYLKPIHDLKAKGMLPGLRIIKGLSMRDAIALKENLVPAIHENPHQISGIYICGPKPMQDQVIGTLNQIKLAMPQGAIRIHHEGFSF